GLDRLTPSGDLRRVEPMVASLAIVGRSADPGRDLGALRAILPGDDIRHIGARRAIVSTPHVEIDLRIARPDEYGTVLSASTGTRAHVRDVLSRATQRPSAGEEDVYAQAGLVYVPPELRDDPGAIRAATAGRLPRLVTRGDIRGDL